MLLVVAATARGVSMVADVPGPMSPLKPCCPFPATVAMLPPLTERTRSLSLSAISSVPLGAIASPRGRASALVLAATPSAV